MGEGARHGSPPASLALRCYPYVYTVSRSRQSDTSTGASGGASRPTATVAPARLNAAAGYPRRGWATDRAVGKGRLSLSHSRARTHVHPCETQYPSSRGSIDTEGGREGGKFCPRITGFLRSTRGRAEALPPRAPRRRVGGGRSRAPNGVEFHGASASRKTLANTPAASFAFRPAWCRLVRWRRLEN